MTENHNDGGGAMLSPSAASQSACMVLWRPRSQVVLAQWHSRKSSPLGSP